MSPSLTTSVPVRLVAGAAVVAAGLSAAPATRASAADIGPALATDHSRIDFAGRSSAGNLDGFRIRHTPCGIGSPSDFEYEWEEVVFHSRVWETGPDEQGTTKVDLMVKTVRGASLTDLAALRGFLTEYHERPDNWDLKAVRIGPYWGYSSGNQLFYFVRPGVGAEVTVDRSRFSEAELLRTSRGFTPE